MNDNEKRAHDLAVAIAIDVCHMKAKEQISQGKKIVDIDYFSEYIKAYETGINAFDKKFSAEK